MLSNAAFVFGASMRRKLEPQSSNDVANNHQLPEFFEHVRISPTAEFAEDVRTAIRRLVRTQIVNKQFYSEASASASSFMLQVCQRAARRKHVNACTSQHHPTPPPTDAFAVG